MMFTLVVYRLVGANIYYAKNAYRAIPAAHGMSL